MAAEPTATNSAASSPTLLRNPPQEGVRETADSIEAFVIPTGSMAATL